MPNLPFISRRRSASSRRRSASKLARVPVSYRQSEVPAEERDFAQQFTAPLCIRNVATLSNAGSHLDVPRHSSDVAAINSEVDAGSFVSEFSAAESGYNIVPTKATSKKSRWSSQPESVSMQQGIPYNKLYMALEACASTTNLPSKLYQGPPPSPTSSDVRHRRVPDPSMDIGHFPCHHRSATEQAIHSTPPGSAFGDRVPQIWWAVVVGKAPGIYYTAAAAEGASGGVANARIIPFTSLDEAGSVWVGNK